MTGHGAQGQSRHAKPDRDGEIEQEQQTQMKMNKKEKSKRIDFGKRSLLKVLPGDCLKVPFFLSSGHPRDVKCKVIVWPSALY